jgi:flagellar biosynthesis protein FliR
MESESLNFIFETWLGSFMLVFVRVLGFTGFGPVFSQNVINSQVRYALTLTLTLIISCLIPALPNSKADYNYFVSLLMNLLVGAFIAYLTRLVLDIVSAAGDIMDNQLGLNAASQLFNDPKSSGGVPSFSAFLRTLGIVIFLYCGAMEATIITLIKSFEIFPLYAWNFAAFEVNMPQVIELTGKIFVLGIVGASPVLLIILFMDIVLNVMNRSAPQINPSSLSFALKPVVGLLIVILIAPLLQARLVQIFLEGVSIFK